MVFHLKTSLVIGARQQPVARPGSTTSHDTPARQYFTQQRLASEGIIVHRGRTQLVCRAEKQQQPFAFEPRNFVKCVLQIASAEEPTANGPMTVGNLVFMPEEDVRKGPDGRFLKVHDSAYHEGKALVMAIGGDTLTSLINLLDGTTACRPYALDLLWTVLQRGQEVSGKDWKLMHVAVVSLQGMAFTARLFFGDPATGKIVWDCDCRPSDGCWLALKTRCPVYVSQEVWGENAQLWRELISLEDQRSEEMDSQIRITDPEPVTRLKREMEVALAEEDYVSAARIRDHPYMMLFRRITNHETAGRTEAAERLRSQLERLIQESNSSPLKGHVEL